MSNEDTHNKTGSKCDSFNTDNNENTSYSSSTSQPRPDGGERMEHEDGAQAFFEEAEDLNVPEMSRLDRFWRSVDRYIYAPLSVAWSDWRARFGILIISFFTFVGTVGVRYYPEPGMNETEVYLSWFQDWSYPLGSNNMGQPIDRLLVHGTPDILRMALAGIIFAVGLAIVIGIVAGYKGGRVDSVLMTITDIVMIIPGLPLVVVLVAIYTPQDPFIVGVVLAIDSWPSLARMLRSQVLTIRHESYVEAARAMNVPTWYIVRRDITPQLMPYIMINAANAARSVIFGAVALYFLGFLPGAGNNWGVVMQSAYDQGAMANLGRAGHWLVSPMILLMIFSLGLILFSQGMDRVFNTKIRARHAKTVEGDEDETVE